MESVKNTLNLTLLDMQTNFEERMASFELDLQKKSSGSASITGLAEEFVAFKSFIMQSLKNIQMQVSALTSELDNMETRSRRKILLVHGIKEAKDEAMAEVVTNIVQNKLMINSFSMHNIIRCHRMGRQKPGDIPRPILLEFQTVTQRDNIWTSKTKLKGTGITISEFLTKTRHAAFMAARETFGIYMCWTREGSVFVLCADGSRHRITSINDLNRIKDADREKPKAAKAGPPRLKRVTSKK